MKDENKTKAQLINELVALRQEIAELEKSDAERKRAEEELRESEDKYRTTFESTGTATVIVEEDTTMSMVNSQFEKLCGYSREELEGKKKWTEFVVKDDLEKMKGYHRGRRIDPDSAPSNYEFRFINRHGEVKDIFLTISMIPGTKKSVASLLDVTERQRAEEALRESEENFRNIFQSVPESLIVVSSQMKVLNSNKAFSELIRKYAPPLNMSEAELRERILSEVRQHFGKTKHGIIEIGKSLYGKTRES